MFQVRIHGRGGQGVVTAAELLSLAAFAEGRHAQAFPTFGSERMGAPVTAFCRIDSGAIRVHDPIAEPDAIIVQDPTLLHQVDVFGGLQLDGYVLLNTAQSFEQLGLGDLVGRLRPGRTLTVPATELAREHLGRPLPNVPMLGAFAALTGVVSLESVATAIGERFEGRVREGNGAAARAAHDLARSVLEEPAHA
jgi:pyruvate ferredoxin oxidoreductase gamma subunit